MRLHVAPLLGGTRLSVLRPDDLQNLYATKQKQGLSPRTVRQLHAVLHRAFSQAVRWGYLSRNVADAVDTTKFPRFELVPPTALNLGRLLDTIGDDPLSALWTLAIYSGCREGELLGLPWQDVDMDARAPSVRQTLLSMRSGVPEFGEPKTASSRRTISLPDDAMVALRRHRQVQE